MQNEKYIVVHKEAGENRHYLILTRDNRGDEWDLPRYNGEISVKEYLKDELGIQGEELKTTGDGINGEILSVEVTPNTQVTATTEEHRGGVFMKENNAKQLLATEDCADTIEKYSQSV